MNDNIFLAIYLTGWIILSIVVSVTRSNETGIIVAEIGMITTVFMLLTGDDTNHTNLQ